MPFITMAMGKSGEQDLAGMLVLKSASPIPTATDLRHRLKNLATVICRPRVEAVCIGSRSSPGR